MTMTYEHMKNANAYHWVIQFGMQLTFFNTLIYQPSWLSLYVDFDLHLNLPIPVNGTSIYTVSQIKA